jgi:4a-hydroxytetrahydrobiopterin dehydratase
MNPLAEKKCVPCEGNIAPFSEKKEDEYLQQIPEWNIEREGIHHLSRKFTFENFVQSMKFVIAVGNLAEEEGHHPNIHIYYNRLTFELHTHAIKGLHENDFIVAAKINEIKI